MQASERHIRRAFERLDHELGTNTNGWREFLGDTRLCVAQQLLSVPGLRLGRVARLSGFRSSVALCHAFSARSPLTPGRLAQRLAERWSLRDLPTDGRELELLARLSRATGSPAAATTAAPATLG